MTTEALNEYVRKHLRLAEEYLEDAKLFLAKGRLRSALDRAYYAMFFAARGILVSRQIRLPKTHSGLIRQFGREVVKTGLVPKEYGKMLFRAFNLRQRGTYEIDEEVEEEETEGIVNEAERFVGKVKVIIERES